MTRPLLPLFALLGSLGCASPATAPDETSLVDAAPAPSVADWIPETIELPPGFAPDLPSGIEQLSLAPGFRDAAADDFWAYALVMWLDETVEDTEHLDWILETYYDGLLSAVGGLSPGADPAQVELTSVEPGLYDARMRIVNTFGSSEPVTLHARIRAEPGSDGTTTLRLAVSSKPRGHAIWRAVEEALSRIEHP